MSAIHTIGHGRHAFKDFLGLLNQHGIRFLCDVRAFARSRWPQFNGLVLAELLRENGIGYEHLPETGGKNKPKPEDLEWGVNRIVEIASDLPTVIMCSESKRSPITKSLARIATASECSRRFCIRKASNGSYTSC